MNARASIRPAIRVAAVCFLVALAVGLAIMVVGTVATGDWYALRLPWSEIGMALITVGLAGGALFLAIDTLVGAIGLSRLVAVPGIVISAFLWCVLLVFGLGGASPGTPVATLLYSAPQYIIVLLASIVLIGLPVVAGRRRMDGGR